MLGLGPNSFILILLICENQTQNVHLGANDGMQAPAEYLQRCGFSGPDDGTHTEEQGYYLLLFLMLSL